MLDALLARPRRIIATLALILVATGVAVGSGASFTSSSSTAASTFATGTLTQSNDKANAAILSASNMKPGDTTSGTVTVTNTGSLAARFTAVESGYVKLPVTTLKLKVTDGTSTVYDGDLGKFGSVDLGVFPAKTPHTLKYTVSYPSQTDAGSSNQNDDQGKTASATYTFNATQANSGSDLSTENTNDTK